MQSINLDNASTSFPKAPGVADAMCRYITEIGSNVGRGGYAPAYDAAEMVIDTRERLARLFGLQNSRHIILTANVTQSLNMILKGTLKPGDHVLVSSMEHNAMMRPLVQLQKAGVRFDRIPCDADGVMQLDAVESMIGDNTRMIATLHASNVCGTMMPIAALGDIAHRHGVLFVVDAAQTAGVFPIDMQAMHIDALAFTGHKGLLCPQGIGGFAIQPDMAKDMEPLLSGGTGSMSDSEDIPAFLPDKFEAGTLNLPGIYGLNAALCYIEKVGMQHIREIELAHAKRLDAALRSMKGARMLGTADWTQRAPIVSVDFADADTAEIAYTLATQYGIQTRCGLHCAPSAHKTLGTFPRGALRLSPSHFSTSEDIDLAIHALKMACTAQ